MIDICAYLLYGSLFWGVGEGLNCMYPRLEDDYNSEVSDANLQNATEVVTHEKIIWN